MHLWQCLESKINRSVRRKFMAGDVVGLGNEFEATASVERANAERVKKDLAVSGQ